MKKAVNSFELLYRGTDCNEWTNAGVHSRIDNRGSIVVLMKIKQTGRRCGGFTSVSWESPSSGSYKKDEHAFLFSLDLNTHFPVIDPSKAIYSIVEMALILVAVNCRLVLSPIMRRVMVARHMLRVILDTRSSMTKMGSTH